MPLITFCFRRAAATSSTTANRPVKKRTTPSVPTPPVTTPAPVRVQNANKLVTLRNYTNIFQLVDGLKYQLPEFGRDLLVPAVVELLIRDIDVSSAVRAHRSIADTSTIEAVDFNSDSNNFDAYLLARTPWSELSSMLTPLFCLTASEVTLGSRAHAKPMSSVISARLRTAVVVNAVLRRFDGSLLRQSREVGAAEKGSSNITPTISDEEDEESVVAGSPKKSSSTSVKLLKKVLIDIRLRTTQQLNDELGPDGASVLLSVSSAVCDCCFFSPNLLVYCSMGDSVFVDVAETSQSATSLRTWAQQQATPTVAFDAAYMLCGRLDATQFEQNFVLRHIPSASDARDTTWSSLAKSVKVAKMGFYVRVYALHCAVNLIVDWLWSRQRFCHSSLFANQPILDAPPVTLVISREMRPLFSQEVFLPFRVAGRTHKFVVKYV